jgi:2-aminoadipate transaminase
MPLVTKAGKEAFMTSGSFDYTSLLAPGVKYAGFPKYNFVGGHNDAEHVPVDHLVAAATAVLAREGRTLATYGLESGPLGYRPLREFLVAKLARDAGISCTADEILVTSGSLQGIELINGLLLSRGDTVLVEQVTYFGSLNRLNRLGIKTVGIPLDEEGLRMDALAAALSQAPRHPAEIHLHHPDRAESDRHHHGRGAPPRTPRAVGTLQRADLRG